MTAIFASRSRAPAAPADRQLGQLQARPAGLRRTQAAGLRLGLLAAVLAAAAGPSWATAVAGGVAISNSGRNSDSGGTAVRNFVPSAPAVGADAPALELIHARIDAVDAEAGSITVRGKPVPLHATRLRVVAPGGQALSGARALRPGMLVRFALEPELRAGRTAAAATASTAATPAVRSIVLIYLDSQP